MWISPRTSTESDPFYTLTGGDNRVASRETLKGGRRMIVLIVTGAVAGGLFMAWLSIPWFERFFRWLFQTRFVEWLMRHSEKRGR